MNLIQEQIDIQLTMDLEKKVEEFVDLKISQIKNKYSDEADNEVKKVHSKSKNLDLDETKNSKINITESSIITQAQTSLTVSQEIENKKIPHLEVRRPISKVNIQTR